MWTHLERQAGGKVKGMGEKQIEVDKRILRTQVKIFSLKFSISIEFNNSKKSLTLYNMIMQNTNFIIFSRVLLLILIIIYYFNMIKLEIAHTSLK